jgi:hypothetical protein
MQENKSAKEEVPGRLQKLVTNKGRSAAINATKEQQLESELIGLEEMRDNELARFVVTLMQYQR